MVVQQPSYLTDYEADFATQSSSGIHIFTDEHKQKNRQVMQIVTDLLPFADINKTNDCDLIYRFLIARKWDVAEAVKSIRIYIQWRQEENIDRVMWETVEDSIKEIVAVFFGLDREGYPVLWDAPNPKLISKVLKVAPRNLIIRAHYKMMESARFLSRTNGVDRLTYVLDLTDVTMSSVTSESIGILKELSKCDQLYFPELGRRMLICNGGWAVNAAWKVLRPLLDERVQKKMQFLKHAPSVSNLAEYIHEDHVHHNYGGVSLGLCGVSNKTLVDQIEFAVSGQVLSFKGAPVNDVPLVKDDHPLVDVRRSEAIDPELPKDETNRVLLRDSKSHSGERGDATPTTNHFEDSQYFSLSDEDHEGDDRQRSAATSSLDWPAFSASTTSRREPGSAGVPPRTSLRAQEAAATRSEVITTPMQVGGPTSALQRPRLPPRSPKVLTFSPLVNSPSSTVSPHVGAQHEHPAKAGAGVLTPATAGRLGSGAAVEIQIKRHGDIIRGFFQDRFVGETQFNLIVSYCDHHSHEQRPPLSSSGLSMAPPPPGASPASTTRSSSSFLESTMTNSSFLLTSPRVLIGQLLRESGHPFHTHLIVADANREAKFVLVKRKFHQQIVIYQVVGDRRIRTSATSKNHTILGDKAKMARCGERTSTQQAGGGADPHDWAVWGKVRVGSNDVRRYFAEKKGWSLVFYDTLATLPISDLFSLTVGLMELWEE
jgi:hypothetical protein